MHLSVLGQNSDIETARGLATFDYSTLEKVEILEYLPLDEPFEGKAITVKNVKIWICPENDVFTAGANLFLDLQVIKDKQGQLQIND